jgi:hypothetical protein
MVAAMRRLAVTVEVDPPTVAAVARTAVADRMAEAADMDGDTEIALDLFPA